eukprot:CAMPEP_0171090322 /NCGR_PEP_ID=MMETSP0766_2-20121228/30264_1 /TAXON_ID=439317 /ORGANISM="Gambierdiscus australes, Strain CAWD 149" /LENGTH=75 /DNA_ID=CAMNT_0011548299 /DNA_START=73 /DNA_END=300 /DNA_ORIENTATION=+
MSDITFSVGMTCEGCSNAITKILSKVEGVEDIDCNLEKKEVHVKYDSTKVTPEDMHKKIQKWADAAGKELGPLPA